MLSLLEYGIMQPRDVWIKQSGDGREAGYTEQLPPKARDLLAFHQYDELAKVSIPSLFFDRGGDVGDGDVGTTKE